MTQKKDQNKKNKEQILKDTLNVKEPNFLKSPEPKYTIMEHLLEIRKRLMYILGSVFIIFFALFPFASELYSILAEPLTSILPENTNMIAISVASPFLIPFKLTFIVSLFLGSPIVLYHLWKFIAPGLYDKEKFFGLPLLSGSVVLFFGGIAFAYFVVFPLMFGFFSSVTPENINFSPDISEYMSFVLSLFLAFGLAFQIPIVVFILSGIGVIDIQTIGRKRPYVITGCFLIGMLLTPPDVISQTLLGLPMWLLYEIGVIAAKLAFANKKISSE